MDLEDIDHCLNTMRLLGNKGATGTQVSFLALFDGDSRKVDELEKRIAEKMGLSRVYPVSGQTYPRKYDSRVLGAVSAVAQSAYKFAQDLRLLQNMREVEEPFESGQIGSSAMAYKRNPMRSERICALARHAMLLPMDAAMTASTQWFERTLDDSANRRLSLPEAFLSVDAVLELYANIAGGMVVYPKMIARHIAENLPFMATENILMEGVRLGGDRQELHEHIRVHSQEAAARMKRDGLDNDLLERIAGDSAFPMGHEELTQLLDASAYVGRAPEQAETFILQEVDPILASAQAMAGMGEINV